MTDVHTTETPAELDVAPNHNEVRADFPPLAIAFCWGAGALAVILGIILGLTLANN
jgi:hypothetical protein